MKYAANVSVEKFIDFGGINMNALEELKETIGCCINESDEYILLDKKIMESKSGGGISSFNIELTDKERSVIYTAVGRKNGYGKLSMELSAVLFTGIEEDICKYEQIGGNKIHIRNNGHGKEAAVTLSIDSLEGENINFKEAIDIINEYGINRLVYKFVRTYPPIKN